MDDNHAELHAVRGTAGYRVLARSYRPTTFDGLIGQTVLVRTLTNAFQSNRIAHAYMLAGVRGVGKTTTARIIARALNCIGPDGAGGITIRPCGVCVHCQAIAEDRHLDVIEMDAASRSKVEEMRELLDGVRYLPTSARFKVYIIDEVHMLSASAFNALLKTLEEPPAHAKFIFATTEIRKVPVTVLSRCQRFDLRRVDAALLAEHLARIAAKEQVEVAPAALQMIARAADGSVRDGLSLLDQAIAHCGSPIEEAAVRDMLGLADRTLIFDLFEAALGGEAGRALGILRQQYDAGADPAAVLEDLLELTHWVARLQVAPEAAHAAGVPEAERERGRDLARRLSVGEVSRTWQLLLKGLGETRTAPQPVQAAEMVLIRLAYAADLPTPAEALRALEAARAAGGGAPAGAAAAPAPPPRPANAAAPEPRSGEPAASRPDSAAPAHPAPLIMAPEPRRRDGGPSPSAAREMASPAVIEEPASFAALVDMVAQQKEALLHAHLLSNVRLVRFEPGHMEIRLEDRAPRDLPQRLSRFLSTQTGRTWLVTVSQAEGQPSLHQQQKAAEAALFEQARAHPLVQAVLQAFPGAVVEAVHPVVAAEADDGGEAMVGDGEDE